VNYAPQVIQQLQRLQEENEHLRRAVTFCLEAMERALGDDFEPQLERLYWTEFIQRMRKNWQ
jgi:hypothetical protein